MTPAEFLATPRAAELARQVEGHVERAVDVGKIVYCGGPGQDVVKLPQQIIEMMESADTASAVMPPTLLYNEGWMLRLMLASAAQGIECFPFAFQPGARWFSEALLYSAFEPRFRADPLAESKTHADGVVGQFSFTPGSKAGLAVRPDATQLIVLEAKMFSSLSKSTKNAPGFDQAARNVACMAETLRRARRGVAEMSSIGFYVIAPQAQIVADVFANELNIEGIRTKIRARVATYEDIRRADLDAWLADYVEPLLLRLQIAAISWESLLARDSAIGEPMRTFYERALRFNAAAVASEGA